MFTENALFRHYVDARAQESKVAPAPLSLPGTPCLDSLPRNLLARRRTRQSAAIVVTKRRLSGWHWPPFLPLFLLFTSTNAPFITSQIVAHVASLSSPLLVIMEIFKHLTFQYVRCPRCTKCHKTPLPLGVFETPNETVCFACYISEARGKPEKFGTLFRAFGG